MYKGKMKISRRRKGQFGDPCCGLSVIFCGFISHLIGRKTINIPELFSGVHGFTGKTVSFTSSLMVWSQFISSMPPVHKILYFY